MPLTPAQKERIEKNRLAALERKRSLSASKSTNSFSQPLSQDSSTSSISSGKKFRPSPVNPYSKSSPSANVVLRPAFEPLSQESIEEKRKEREAQELKRREDELLPPLPEGAPPIREATIQRLSEQQLEVIKLARPPTNTHRLQSNNDSNNEQPQGYRVRITAAAGTGKTTTLLHLAVRCLDLQHTNVTYVTYSRASASDAKERILQMAAQDHDGVSERITASTLHSCVMKLLLVSENDESNVEDEEKGLIDEVGLRRLLLKQYEREINDYLDPALRRLREDDSLDIRTERERRKDYTKKERMMRDQVVHYLIKSFAHFLRSGMTFEEYKDDSRFSRHFYPVKIDFRIDGKAGQMGFPSAIYSVKSSYSFYANTCVKLWEYVLKHNIRSYDIEMKKAQLKNLRIPCSVLLVDECQDLDGCQVAFIANQREFGTQVFFVGDACQSLYSFRGAKPSYVTSLPDCVDRFITKSWRFGPAIAKVANVALFVKENSPQTNNTHSKQWQPYRIETARSEEYSTVTSNSLIRMGCWNKRPVAIIAWKNGTLLRKALDLMNLGHLEVKEHDSDDENSGISSLDGEQSYKVESSLDEDFHSLVQKMPKFHINGKGEASGAKGWRSAIKQIQHLYELYMSKEDGGSLPVNLFEEFVDYDKITWGDFMEAYKAQELNKYAKAVEVILTYRKNTMKAVKYFEAQLDSKYSEDDADFILATCHSAKGLEWDHVELCDDFMNFHSHSYVCNATEKPKPPFLSSINDLSIDTKPVVRLGWQFGIKNYGDDLNLIYVAITRAKKTLSLPKTIETLLRDLDLIHFYANDLKNAKTKPVESDESMIVLEKEKRKLTKGEVWNLYHDLCIPLREELNVDRGTNILNLFGGHDERDEIEGDGRDKIKPEEEQSQHFDC